jgi:hypothetical protein
MAHSPVMTAGFTSVGFVPTLARPLAPNVFETQINAMQAHYKTLPLHSFATAIHVFQIPGLRLGQLHTLKDSAPAILKQIHTAGKAAATTWASRTRDRVTAIAQNLRDTTSTDDFDSQIDQAEQQTQQEAHDAIHNYFEDIKKSGHDHPDLQPDLVKTAQQGGDFWAGLVSTFKAFVASLISKVKQWVAAAVQWVEKAVSDAVQWAENAISDVADFFGL